MNGEVSSRKLSQDLTLNKLEKKSLSIETLLPISHRDKCSRSRLGPGCYNLPLNTFQGPSFHFSQSQRFISSDPYSKYLNNSKKSSNHLSIPEIKLENFRPAQKLSNIKKVSQALSQKLSITKSNKKRLEQQKKYKFLKTFKEKSLKFYLRQKVKEFKPLSKIFHVLMISLTASCVWKVKEFNLKLKKMKIFENVGFLRAVVRAVGRFRTLLRKIRMFKSYWVIKKAVERIKLWMRKRKDGYRSQIDLVCNHYVSRYLLKNVLVKFDVVIRGIQQAWKRIYLARKSTLKAKFRIFRMFEKVIVPQFTSKYLAPIRKVLILKELESFRKKKFREYYRELIKYRKKCRDVDNKLQKQITKYGNLKNAQPTHINHYPKKPVASYFINKTKYIEMIIYLINRRSQRSVKIEL